MKIETELKKFLLFKQQFTQNSEFTVEDIDDYGFTLQSSDKSPVEDIEFLICGLTHGNEVIGLEIINLILETLFNCNMQIPIKLGFLLNNVQAATSHVRYKETDLNRSFGKQQHTLLEEKRALQIQSIVKKSRFILDLHQTVEKTDNAFFVLPHNENLIQIAHNFDPQTPIVTFPQNGFSKEGLTLVEFAQKNKIPALVIETSQLGFNSDIANYFTDIVIDHIFKFKEIFSVKNDQIEYYQMNENITKDHGQLQKNLVNFLKFNIGDQLADHYIATFEGIVLFPRYNEMAAKHHELAQLAIKKILK